MLLQFDKLNNWSHIFLMFSCSLISLSWIFLIPQRLCHKIYNNADSHGVFSFSRLGEFWLPCQPWFFSSLNFLWWSFLGELTMKNELNPEYTCISFLALMFECPINRYLYSVKFPLINFLVNRYSVKNKINTTGAKPDLTFMVSLTSMSKQAWPL